MNVWCKGLTDLWRRALTLVLDALGQPERSPGKQTVLYKVTKVFAICGKFVLLVMFRKVVPSSVKLPEHPVTQKLPGVGYYPSRAYESIGWCLNL
ncbi:hypothetical protein V6N12_073118 [Hibiscus sabdariffa]|uniref:Uncharacterized protein n=1 Tax=Hibiscus sabdariffa TaxID=183260 RepID=A0ABR1Z6V7_9ROSI